MRILISGASGMMGRALVESLSRPSAATRFSPEISTLVRRAPASSREVYFDCSSRIDARGIEGFDAVVHLAGENVGSGSGPLAFVGRWDDAKKHDILHSRRAGTALLARALAACKKKPRVLVCASGVGYYGADCGDTVLDERAPAGGGFLAKVAQAWEEGAAPAREAGIRVVNLRFGVVLSKTGGVIRPIGPGTQYMSWITLTDAVRAIEHAISCEELEGPANACAPEPATGAAFAAALGAAVHRPAIIPLPTFAVRTIFGEMGDETLLASQRAVPQKLLATGFHFLQKDIVAGCEEALLR